MKRTKKSRRMVRRIYTVIACVLLAGGFLSMLGQIGNFENGYSLSIPVVILSLVVMAIGGFFAIQSVPKAYRY